MTVLNLVRAAVQKRAEYKQTKFELSNMPLSTAHDLGIFREDAAKIANEAVYG